MFKRDYLRLLAFLLVGGALMAMVACGPAEEEEEPAPGATPPAVGETPDPATATPVPDNGLAALPAPEAPVGTIWFVRSSVIPGPGLNREMAPWGGHHWGIGENLFMTGLWPDERHLTNEPMLATGFEFSDDLSTLTIHIREGIEFHNGWGEMTAEDVAWSLNDAKSDVTPESIHRQAGDHAGLFDGAWRVVDQYTVEVDLHLPDPRMPAWNLGEGFQGPIIISKAHYDSEGEDAARDLIVSTGPFRQVEWTTDDRIVGERVEDHWRQTAQIERFVVNAVPETSTQLAQLLTGGADVGQVPVRDLNRVLDQGFVQVTNGLTSDTGYFWPGNLWETEHFLTGEPVSRDGLQPELPWIGDPDDEESMRQARDVRWALALATDKEAINEVILDGHGETLDMSWYNPNDPLYQDRWRWEYDPDQARQLLEGAGYGGGFDITLYSGAAEGINAEIGDAIAGMWEDIGVTADIWKGPYAAVYRPGLVSRSETAPWISSCDEGKASIPLHWPSGLVMSTMSRGGFSCGNEDPVAAQAFWDAAHEPDEAARAEIVIGLADHLHEWALNPGIVSNPVFRVYNPRAIESWQMRMGWEAPETALENIVPAR